MIVLGLKLFLLFICLLAPLIPVKKKRKGKLTVDPSAKMRSDYGVTAYGDIERIDKEGKNRY
jgi:hypothetical protein